jgi:hypothetical protein
MTPDNDRPGPAPGSSSARDDDAGRWREAARLRREHSGWIVIWLAPTGCYRAYRRLPGVRRDTALTAATPADLAAQITHAEQAARNPASHAKDPA